MGDRTTHARLSASGAYRWWDCPGSVVIHELVIPDRNDDSEWSIEGTCAHEVGDHCLKEDKDAWEFIGQSFFDIEVTDEMAIAVQEYVDHCREIWASADHTHPETKQMIEQSLSDRMQTEVHEDAGGTSDHAVVSGREWLHVTDYKHGAGIAVSIKENKQLMYYGVGILLDHPNVEEIRLSISQPRIPWFEEGPWRTETYTRRELLGWLDELREKMKVIDTDTSLRHGEHCRFCPAKIACPIHRGMFQAALNADIKSVSLMTNAQLEAEKDQVKIVKMYLKAVDDEVYLRLNQGEGFHLWKMIQKMGHRVFKSGAEAKLKKKYGDKAYTPGKLKSPAQIEKLPGGGKYTAALAFKPKAGLTVAPMTDKHDAVKISKPEDTYKGLTTDAKGE